MSQNTPMRQTLLRVLAAPLSLALSLLPASALAGGYFIPNQNARDLGLSQAAVAAQTGPEAAYQNPAALAGQRGFSVSASLQAVLNQTDWTGTDALPGSASLEPKWSTPPALSLAWGHGLPNDMAYGVGLFFLTPGGGALNWPANWPGAQKVQTVSQQVFLAGFSLAFQPAPFLKLGGALTYTRVVEELTQKVGFGDHLADARLGLGGGGFGYSAAIQLDAPWFPLTLAASYLHKADVQLTGAVHFSGVPPTFQSLLQDQGITAGLTVPNSLHVGASYLLPLEIRLMADWSFERWSVYANDTFVGDHGFTVTVPRAFVDAQVYRLAAEWSHVGGTGLVVRLGGLRSVSPQPTATVSPSLPDTSSWAFSVGAGYEIIPALRVDVGYQHAIFDPLTASGTEALGGTYNTRVELLSLGLTFRLGGEAKAP